MLLWLSFAFFESSAIAVKLVELPCFDRRFPCFVSVGVLSRGNTGLLDTVVGWRFQPLFVFYFLFYNALRWMGTRAAFSDGLALGTIW